MAIARHSNDGGKWCDEDGIFITTDYNHHIFMAKISKVDSIGDYLKSDYSINHRGAYTYNYPIDCGWWSHKEREGLIIISE